MPLNAIATARDPSPTQLCASGWFVKKQNQLFPIGALKTIFKPILQILILNPFPYFNVKDIFVIDHFDLGHLQIGV